jgi:hypothetical protein
MLRRLIGPLAVALLVVGATSAAVHWLATAPTFRVSEIEVASGGRVPPLWARDQLEHVQGRHILLVELAEFEARLTGHPWVRGVEVDKRLPAAVHVRVLEKEPVALLKAGDELFFLDGEGGVIAPYEPDPGSPDFILVEADPADREGIREALRLADEWSRKGGRWAEGLSEIAVADATSFKLVVAGLEFPLLMDRAGLERVDLFERILPEIIVRYPELRMADLRFAGQIVFQPVVRPPTKG